jgi:hypothetical protein
MEIIPKPKPKAIPLEIIFATVSFLILISVVFVSIYFFFDEKKKKREISQIEEKISALRTPQIKEIEEKVLKYQRKISFFSDLVKNHLHPSKIFPYLEQKTNKNVYFSSFDFDLENSKIILAGETPDFPSLFQQLEIFKEDPHLKTELKEMFLSKEGKVGFKLEISFDKEILK